MDDHSYLMRLLSLLFEASERGVRLRFASDAQAKKWHDDNRAELERWERDPQHKWDPKRRAATALQNLGSYFAGALDGNSLDSEQLPEFALEAMLYMAGDDDLLSDVESTSWRVVVERQELQLRTE